MLKNVKIILWIIVGIIIGAIVTTKASTLLNSKDIFYDNSKTGLTADVNSALNETYEKAVSLSEKIKVMEEPTYVLDKIYPVGSIFISTELKTIEEVSSKIGGTWEVYSSGKTLVGNDGSTYKAGNTGGSSTVKLTNSNLPSHSHVIPALSGSTVATDHVQKMMKDGEFSITPGGNTSAIVLGTPVSNTFTASMILHLPTLSLTTNESNTTTCTNCSNTAFSVQDPYIVVYMYKRVK